MNNIIFLQEISKNKNFNFFYFLDLWILLTQWFWPKRFGQPWIRQRSLASMRSLSSYTQEVQQNNKILPINSWTAEWGGDRRATPTLHHGRHPQAVMDLLTSSPGLRTPIISQPYGFQLWLLADVCPTQCSIIGTLGTRCRLLGLSRIPVRFWLSGLISEFPPQSSLIWHFSFTNKTQALNVIKWSCCLWNGNAETF